MWKSFNQYLKQYTFAKNSNENTRIWGTLLAPVAANSGRKTCAFPYVNWESGREDEDDDEDDDDDDDDDDDVDDDDVDDDDVDDVDVDVDVDDDDDEEEGEEGGGGEEEGDAKRKI